MQNEYKMNLSIIIPHYNTPELLEKLIESIPHIKDIQIIVIDDNSDIQLEKLKDIQVKYCNQVEFYKNNTSKKGAGTCRNIGIQHAEGKWLLFADADDFFLEGMYDIIFPYFELDYDEVFFTPTSIYLDSGNLSNRHEIFERRICNYIAKPSRENLLKLKVATTTPCSNLIKHDLVQRHKIYFDEVLYSNDIMFMAKVGHYSQKVAVSKKIIYCITRSKGSLTTHMDWNAYKIRLYEYLKICKFIKKRYSLKDMKLMHYTCLGILYRAIQQRFGIKKYFHIIGLFQRNGIPLFSWDQLKCEGVIQIIKDMKSKRIDSKYYVKDNEK